MKQLLKLVSLVSLFAVGLAHAADEARVIEFHTEKIGEVMHWMPERVTVSPGEKVKFVLKHELVGGMDFHGFTIRELDIVKQVDRNKTVEVEKVIPANLKAGEYKVTCQFHPKHAAASVLVVTAGPIKKAAPAEHSAPAQK